MIENQDFEWYLKTLYEHLCCNMTEEQRKKEYFVCYDYTEEQIINTYDNTILYTDFILSSVIDTLKKFPHFESGMLYVSDHGESLGESNIYLHGLPYSIASSEQTDVPMIIWMSEAMKKYDYIDYDCLKNKAKNMHFSHDNILTSFAL